MKAIGKIIKLTVKAGFGMLMETFLKGNGKMTKPMVMDNIFM